MADGGAMAGGDMAEMEESAGESTATGSGSGSS